ncbi:MAG: hypothetical protein RMK18_04010 [Armatimonadota bacterium]|nr:hypothetical protein [Armatimonadota bacterium]MCX7777188.1 hypothetical protein [Armatimonadota bacterium]MDW8025015.1 hypothetical protein [Armatimonadota bacterium]
MRSAVACKRRCLMNAAFVVCLIASLPKCSTAQVEVLGMPCYGINARALGMGGASVAVVGDLGSLLANPAATVRLPEPVASLSGRLNTTNERYFLAGYLRGSQEGKLGGGLTLMWARDESPSALGGRTTHFGLLYTITQPIGMWRGYEIDFGTTIKMHQQRIAGQGSRTNWTFDIGFLTRLAERTWIGISSINTTRPSFTMGTVRKRDERLINAGVAHWFDEDTLLAVDVWDLEDNTTDWAGGRGSGIAIRVGLERRLTPSLTGRIGMLDRRLTIGFGFRGGFMRGMHIDYAFSDRPSPEDDIHLLSMSVSF